MSDDNRELKIALSGFWLPCDQANFFHHENNAALRDFQVLKTFDRSKEMDSLEDQVFHRLMMVLPDFGYTHAIPVNHAYRPYGDDPDAAVFVNMNFTGSSFVVQDEKDDVTPATLPKDIQVHGIAMLANSSGFYLWILPYSISRGAPSEEEARVAEGMQDYLQKYIYSLVGGNFASRYSGWKDDEHLAFDEYERTMTLLKYRKEHMGILTFMQINTIFEGLYSSALDFNVFFYDGEAREKRRVDHVKRLYSLGSFIHRITLPVERRHYTGHEPIDTQWNGDESGSTSDAPDVAKFLHTLNRMHPRQGSSVPEKPRNVMAEAHYLCHDYLGEKGCGVLLRKFLQATSSETLQKYKRRIERCRRALVTEILQVTQRQEPVLQVEVPPTGSDTEDGENAGGTRDPEELADRIVGVNESQLRGYVLLFSAKLPLINNVRLYLTEIGITNLWYRPRKRDQQEHAGQKEHAGHKDLAGQEVNAALETWKTLHDALVTDLAGLERAIAQERQDRMVEEEEKIRAEQETLAEIERLQDRNAGTLSAQTTLTLGLLSNAFALASVLVAVVGIINKPNNILTVQPGTWTPTQVVEFVLTVLALGMAMSALYIVAHYCFMLVFGFVARVFRVRRRGRYYYEMDLHMEAPFDTLKIEQLLKGEFPRVGRSYEIIQRWEDAKRARLEKGQSEPKGIQWVSDGMRFWSRVVSPAFHAPDRNSYRVERMSANEAMHKIYVDVAVLLPREHWYQLVRRAASMVLVYEVLYHRPALAQRYILQDLRVVSTHSWKLSTSQLTKLKRLIAQTFVNPLLDQNVVRSRISTDPEGEDNMLRDALMSLTTVDDPAQIDASSRFTRRERWAREWADFESVLIQLGVVGFIVFAGQALIKLLTVASQRNFNALLNDHVLIGILWSDEVQPFISEHVWLVAIVPPALSLLLPMLGIFLGSLWRLLVRSVVAIIVSDSAPAARPAGAAARNTTQEPQAHNDARLSKMGEARTMMGVPEQTNPRPDDRTGQGMNKEHQRRKDTHQTMADASPATAEALATRRARLWRWVVLRAWALAGLVGACVETIVAAGRIVLMVLATWVGVALAMPTVADVINWVGTHRP